MITGISAKSIRITHYKISILTFHFGKKAHTFFFSFIGTTRAKRLISYLHYSRFPFYKNEIKSCTFRILPSDMAVCREAVKNLPHIASGLLSVSANTFSSARCLWFAFHEENCQHWVQNKLKCLNRTSKKWTKGDLSIAIKCPPNVLSGLLHFSQATEHVILNLHRRTYDLLSELNQVWV